MGAGASSTLQLTDLDQAGYERLAAAAGDHIDQDVARSFEALCAEGNQTLSLSVGLGEGSLAVTADPGEQQQAGLISLVGVGMGVGDEQQQAAAAQAARLAAQFEAEASPASRMSAKARRLSNALSNAAVPSSMTDAIDAKLRVSGGVPTGGLAGGVDLPGRLGDPVGCAWLADDPRLDPRLVGATRKAEDLSPDEYWAVPCGAYNPGTASSPRGRVVRSEETVLGVEGADEGGHEDLRVVVSMPHRIRQAVHVHTAASSESSEGAEGVAGKLITQRAEGVIHRIAASPTSHNVNLEDLYLELLPCIIHAGCSTSAASSSLHARWRDELAAKGHVVIGVSAPFPAGLDAVTRAMQWAFENRRKLGIFNIVLAGEGLGATISLATLLRARDSGTLGHVAGMYLHSPLVAGPSAYSSAAAAAARAAAVATCSTTGDLNNCRSFPSLVENSFGGHHYGVEAAVSLTAEFDRWPLPSAAAQNDAKAFAGLPPHAVSINELCPHRDEGLCYARMLRRAGVDVTTRTVHGCGHLQDVRHPEAAAALYEEAVASVARFVASLPHSPDMERDDGEVYHHHQRPQATAAEKMVDAHTNHELELDELHRQMKHALDGQEELFVVADAIDLDIPDRGVRLTTVEFRRFKEHVSISAMDDQLHCMEFVATKEEVMDRLAGSENGIAAYSEVDAAALTKLGQLLDVVPRKGDHRKHGECESESESEMRERK